MMIVGMLVGASISIVGLAAGFVLGSAFRRQRGSSDLSKPICTCKHGFSMHRNGQMCATTWCECQVYVGPDPMLSGHWTPSKSL